MSCPACESDNIMASRNGGWQCKRCLSKWFPKDEKAPVMDAPVVTTQKILSNPSMKRFRMIDMKNRVPWDKSNIIELLKKGVSRADIADIFNIPVTTVAKVMRESISEEKRVLIGESSSEHKLE